MNWKTPVLVAASAVTAALFGCTRDTYDESESHSTVADTPSVELEKTIPSGWAETSAAYPLGWADMAERRALEFELGSEPPSAIGGGPTSVEDDDHDDD